MNASGNIWQDCKRLLIVFPYTDEVVYKEYRKALDVLLNDSNVQDLKLVVVLPDNIKKESLQPHRLIHFLSLKEFNFFGKLKDASFDTVLAQPYDLMLWLQLENKRVVKLMQNVHATWKIGVNADADFFDVEVDTASDKPAEIVNFAKQTLEKITSYE